MNKKVVETVQFGDRQLEVIIVREQALSKLNGKLIVHEPTYKLIVEEK